jgi:hypothetical protein
LLWASLTWSVTASIPPPRLHPTLPPLLPWLRRPRPAPPSEGSDVEDSLPPCGGGGGGAPNPLPSSSPARTALQPAEGPGGTCHPPAAHSRSPASATASSKVWGSGASGRAGILRRSLTSETMPRNDRSSALDRWVCVVTPSTADFCATDAGEGGGSS